MNEPSLSSKANLISISSGPWALLLKLLAHFFPAKRDRQSTSRLVFAARLRPEFRMPPVRGPVVRIRGMVQTQHFWIRTSLSSTAAARRHTASILLLHAMIGGGCRSGKLQNVSPPSVLFE